MVLTARPHLSLTTPNNEKHCSIVPNTFLAIWVRWQASHAGAEPGAESSDLWRYNRRTGVEAINPQLAKTSRC
jgi:hypothetical protein